mmetsp:Transcript_81267/g.226252  ORF Transcript_81267/g.226252 Transcript_81267/m.226252 type:complete len:242 (-) Transcript_81267:540-1265(-)
MLDLFHLPGDAVREGAQVVWEELVGSAAAALRRRISANLLRQFPGELADITLCLVECRTERRDFLLRADARGIDVPRAVKARAQYGSLGRSDRAASVQTINPALRFLHAPDGRLAPGLDHAEVASPLLGLRPLHFKFRPKPLYLPLQFNLHDVRTGVGSIRDLLYVASELARTSTELLLQRSNLFALLGHELLPERPDDGFDVRSLQLKLLPQPAEFSAQVCQGGLDSRCGLVESSAQGTS